MAFSMLWIVFSLSFIMALSGALMPGPLLTYTIARTMQTRRRGFLVGAWVIAGHAALEGVLICGLALGVAQALRAPLVLKVVGTAGALVLGYMGVGMILEAVRGPKKRPETRAAMSEEQRPQSGMSPVLAGTLVSLANPYWWIWWITVGTASLARFDASLANWPVLLAFFVGHEAGDLAWYLVVSTAVFFGKRGFSRGFSNILLTVCGVFIIGFGLYLGLSQFVKL
jgi:threonine/homoserine/homoserine lactone efflux protein